MDKHGVISINGAIGQPVQAHDQRTVSTLCEIVANQPNRGLELDRKGIGWRRSRRRTIDADRPGCKRRTGQTAGRIAHRKAAASPPIEYADIDIADSGRLLRRDRELKARDYPITTAPCRRRIAI